MHKINTRTEIKYNSILLNNSKNKWSRLNKLLNDATCKSDDFICCDHDLEVSNKFNEYFSEVGTNLSKIINPVSNIDKYSNLIPIPSSHFTNLRQ